MRLPLLSQLVVGTLLGSPAAIPRTPSDTCPTGLIGTWRLTLYEDSDSTGRMRYPYGTTPQGYLVYDKTGHMQVQITVTPALSKWPDDTTAAAVGIEASRSLSTYEAYFGTYAVDCKLRVVTHIVEGQLNRDYVGTRQERPFRLHGDSLILGVPARWRRVFLRVP